MVVNTKDLKDFFLSLGYTEEDYLKIISNPRIKKHSNEYVVKKVSEVHRFLLGYYSQEEVVKIVRKFTSIFTYSVSNMSNKTGDTAQKGKSSGDNEESESMEEKMTGLMTLGYTKKDVLTIIKDFPEVFGYPVSRINKNITNVVEVARTRIKGKKIPIYTRTDVIKMIKFYPSLIGSGKQRLIETIRNIVSMGIIEENGKKVQVYKRVDALSIAKRFPVVFRMSKERMETGIGNIMKQGYDKKEALRIVRKSPSILGNNPEYIKERIEGLMLLGYSREEAMAILLGAPTLYGISKELLIEKKNALVGTEYTEGEILQMGKTAPMIFTSSTSGMLEKISYYDSIGMHDYMLNNPRQFIQSVALTYARYMFFKDNGIDTETVGFDKLFTEESFFRSKYNVSKEALLEQYRYEDYIKQKEEMTSSSK